jgi:hypothetical protein
VSRRLPVALAVVATAALVITIGFIVELVRSHFVQEPVRANYVTVLLAIVVSALAIGTLAARSQRSVGVLLVAAAAGAGVGYWRFSTHPWAAAIGFATALCTALLPLHAALVHGAGISRRARAALVGAQGALIAIGLVVVCTAPAGAIDRWFVAADSQRHARNPLGLVDAPTFARAMYGTWWIGLVVVSAAFTAVRFATWLKEPVPARRREAPVVAATIAWTIVVGTGAGFLTLHRSSGARLLLADYGAIMLPAIGLALIAAAIGWVELVRPRLGRVQGGEVELRAIEPQDAGALRALLSDVLGTPRVSVVFAGDDGWIDDAGRAVHLPDDPDRATTIRQPAGPIAALIHDPDVPFESVELAARLTAAHIEAQRASALARSRTEAVRAAAGRLVRAGDKAATEVGRQLTQGPVAALDALATRLRSGTDALPEAQKVLSAVTAEVRGISHGVFPRSIDEGLAAVLAVPGTPTRRLPPTVELTVYLLTSNDGATIADGGDVVTITRSTPVPADLLERIWALGGTVTDTVVTLPIVE